MPYLTDDPKCPKCGQAMLPIEVTAAIPGYIEHDKRPKSGERIDPKIAFPLEMHRCGNCRYVEFFAG